VITALLRAEVRKTASVRLWWALLVPAVLLAVLVGVFSGVFTVVLGVPPAVGDGLPLLVAAQAYALGVAAVLAALHGAVATAGEFRHRTVTTTYLTAPGRAPVLVAQALLAAAVGAGYAVAVSVAAVLAGVVARGGERLPALADLLLVAGIGAAVCALWGALGAALGVLAGNQVGAVVGLLGWTQLAEPLLSLLLSANDALAPVTAYLPVNAGETALYTIPAAALGGSVPGSSLVGAAAGVTGPLPWPAALAVLAGWAVVAVLVAARTAGRRDVT
jgi:hypothetical protein